MKTIKLSGKHGGYAVIDDDDYEYCLRFNWFNDGLGYAHRNIGRCPISKKKPFIRMHREVMLLKKGDKLQVDHINGNRLDNRKENLRLCTPQQQRLNLKTNNKYGYKGVCLHKKTNTYQARVTVDGKTHCLKYHETPEKAALAYNKKAKELHGEFARLNEVPNGTTN